MCACVHVHMRVCVCSENKLFSLSKLTRFGYEPTLTVMINTKHHRNLRPFQCLAGNILCEICDSDSATSKKKEEKWVRHRQGEGWKTGMCRCEHLAHTCWKALVVGSLACLKPLTVLWYPSPTHVQPRIIEIQSGGMSDSCDGTYRRGDR